MRTAVSRTPQLMIPARPARAYGPMGFSPVVVTDDQLLGGHRRPGGCVRWAAVPGAGPAGPAGGGGGLPGAGGGEGGGGTALQIRGGKRLFLGPGGRKKVGRGGTGGGGGADGGGGGGHP